MDNNSSTIERAMIEIWSALAAMPKADLFLADERVYEAIGSNKSPYEAVANTSWLRSIMSSNLPTP